MSVLSALLRSISGRVIVFVNRKDDCQLIMEYRDDNDKRIDARQIHGDVTQAQRDNTMAQFKQGRFKVLVRPGNTAAQDRTPQARTR